MGIVANILGEQKYCPPLLTFKFGAGTPIVSATVNKRSRNVRWIFIYLWKNTILAALQILCINYCPIALNALIDKSPSHELCYRSHTIEDDQAI